jgi:outer membrane protein TolC
MNQLKLLLVFILLTLFFSAKAQNSLSQDISAAYLDTLVKIAKENYPRLRTLDEQIRIAKNNVNKGKLSFLDVLSFSYLYSPSNNINYIDPRLLNGYQFGVALNFGTLLQKPSNLKIYKSELQIANNQKQEYSLNLEANVKDRYYQYMEKLSILKLRTRATSDTESMLTSTRNKFERGQETLDTYTKVLVLLNEQSQQKVVAESEMLSAKAFLEELLGKKLEEINY